MSDTIIGEIISEIISEVILGTIEATPFEGVTSEELDFIVLGDAVKPNGPSSKRCICGSNIFIQGFETVLYSAEYLCAEMWLCPRCKTLLEPQWSSASINRNMPTVISRRVREAGALKTIKAYTIGYMATIADHKRGSTQTSIKYSNNVNAVFEPRALRRY